MLFSGTPVYLVVDIGNVANIFDMLLAKSMPQQAEHNIEYDNGPGIADMSKVINRWTADIHSHVLHIERREVFFFAC